MALTPGIPAPARPCLDCGAPTRLPGQRCAKHRRSRRKTYSSSSYRAARERCLDRWQRSCALCNDRPVDVHHIDGNAANHQDINLIALCHHHHNSADVERRRGGPGPVTALIHTAMQRFL